MPPSIAILGDYSPDSEPHRQTEAAIAHSAAAIGADLSCRWVATDAADDSLLRTHRGLWVAPGSPYKGFARTLSAIRLARETGTPCLGTCGGFQHMVLEYARNVLGFRDAAHAEYDPSASDLFLSKLACSLVGREMTLRFVPGSKVAGVYGSTAANESYYCNFGVNPDRVDLLRSSPLRVVGSDAEGEVRVVELPGHPFFVGTLYLPQARSTPDAPHPLVTAFVKAVAASPGAR